jgi:Uma2 family endonuclease
MEQKLREYFSAGVRLVWYVDPALQEIHVYTAPDQREVLTADHLLRGGEVLPGFTLPVRQLFAEPTEGPDHQQAL